MRFGSAELYQVLDLFPEIQDSLAVGKTVEDDEIVILFVKPIPGYDNGGEKWDALVAKIKKELRVKRSARHVPSKVSTVCLCAVSCYRNLRCASRYCMSKIFLIQ